MLNALVDRFRAVDSTPWNTENSSGWGSWGGEATPTWSGAAVNQTTAQPQLLAVYGSASFITDEISTLPIHVDVHSGGSPFGAAVHGDDIARPVWVDQPTEGLDRVAWMSQIVWSLLLAGNAYIAVREARPGEVLAMDVLDPEQVTVRKENGRKVFYVQGQMLPGSIIHIPGRMRPGGIVGVSPVEWCRQTIGLGLAATKYGAEFFDGEGNMPGVIEAPGGMQPETQRELARQWQRKRKQNGRGLPGILQNGASWKPTGVNHEQAQFLATRKWTAAEIAGQMFMLDPSDLGIPVEGSSLTYANLEQRNVRRMQVAMMPWIRRIEGALSPWLPGPAEYHFDVDSRLRGNTRESYETLAVATAAGFITVEEVRNILGLPPLPEDPPFPEPMTPGGVEDE